jgi:hypothetical protein
MAQGTVKRWLEGYGFIISDESVPTSSCVPR